MGHVHRVRAHVHVHVACTCTCSRSTLRGHQTRTITCSDSSTHRRPSRKHAWNADQTLCARARADAAARCGANNVGVPRPCPGIQPPLPPRRRRALPLPPPRLDFQRKFLALYLCMCGAYGCGAYGVGTRVAVRVQLCVHRLCSHLRYIYNNDSPPGLLPLHSHRTCD